GVRRRSRAAAQPAATPPGWWLVAADEADPAPAGREPSDGLADAELARVLSLPYAAGVREAADGRFGVRAWDRARAQPGWNLYVSGHAPEARLIGMDGRLLHRWRIPFAEAFPEATPNIESGFFRRAHLLANGDLLAIFQGFGLLRLDAASNLVWRYPAALFNDLWVSPDGQRIL